MVYQAYVAENDESPPTRTRRRYVKSDSFEPSPYASMIPRLKYNPSERCRIQISASGKAAQEVNVPIQISGQTMRHMAGRAIQTCVEGDHPLGGLMTRYIRRTLDWLTAPDTVFPENLDIRGSSVSLLTLVCARDESLKLISTLMGSCDHHIHHSLGKGRLRVDDGLRTRREQRANWRRNPRGYRSSICGTASRFGTPRKS